LKRNPLIAQKHSEEIAVLLNTTTTTTTVLRPFFR